MYEYSAISGRVCFTAIYCIDFSLRNLFSSCFGMLLMNKINRLLILVFSEIIPRLFALLNHFNSYVRQTVCRILERIGESSPYAICFPSITNGGANGLCDSMINKENEDDVNIERTKWSDGDARNANVLAQHFQEHMNIKDSADQVTFK